MLITLQDDSVVRLYPSVDAAVKDVEALDAEEVFQSIFDEEGQRYAIRWIRPNRIGRFLVTNGQYTLARETRDIDGLLALIREARFIEPPQMASELKNIERRLNDEVSSRR